MYQINKVILLNNLFLSLQYYTRVVKEDCPKRGYGIYRTVSMLEIAGIEAELLLVNFLTKTKLYVNNGSKDEEREFMKKNRVKKYTESGRSGRTRIR